MASMLKRETRKLTPSQAAIMAILKSGPKNRDEIGAAVGRSYQAVYRPVKQLVDAGWIEVDESGSAFERAARFRIKRAPNDGVDFLVNVDGKEQAVSFNTLLESIARQRELPEIATKWRLLRKAFAELGAYAADEVEQNGTVTEGDLLTILAELTEYADALQEEFGLVEQMRQDLRLWNPALLKSATLLQTDRHLSPNQVRAFAQAIAVKYDLFEVTENESESDENDYAEE